MGEPNPYRTIWDLGLHESIVIQSKVDKIFLQVLRVPGGWIYTQIDEDLFLGSVFVPEVKR